MRVNMVKSFYLVLSCFFFLQIMLAENVLAADDTVIITAGEIAKMQAHNMADILNTVPGVSASSSSVSIHGNYKVKVFLDGRPLNDPTSSYGAVNWDMVSPSDVEKIEILRGKGGVRYGQDASGGVILVSTKSSKMVTGKVKILAGSEESYSVNISLQWVKDRFSGSLRGGYDSTEGYQVNNDHTKYQAGTTLAYSFSDQAKLSFSADYSDDERGYAGYPDYPTPHSRAENTLQTYSLVGEIGTVTAKTFYTSGEKHNIDNSRNLDSTVSVDKTGLDLTSSTKTDIFGELSYGAGVYRNTGKGSSFDEQQEDTTSLFLIDSYDFATLPINITLGVRANFNSAFDDSINPEAKISYKQTKWKATLSYNRTNNTPSFFQRYNESSTIQPNPDLDMEIADNYSLAFFAKLSAKIDGSLTFFHNRLSERITYIYGEGGTSMYQNVGSATYTGSDVSLTWKICNAAKLKTNYTYLEAKDEDTGLYLTTKSRHKGRFDLSVNPTDEFSAIFSGRGNSSVFLDRANTKTLDGVFLYDCKLQYDFDRHTLFFKVTNLLDEEYLYVDGLLAPPRTWFAGIQMRI